MACNHKTEELWRRALAKCGIVHATLLSQSDYDPYRRSYVEKGHVYKIVLSKYECTSYMRAQTIEGEYKILKGCRNIKGVPQAIKYWRVDDIDVLELACFPGTTLNNVELTWPRLLIVLIRVCVIVLRLSIRGVSHNDILPSNILITENGSVILLDFDQATFEKPGVALLRQLFGIRRGGYPVYGSVLRTLKIEIVRRLSPSTVQFLKKLLGRPQIESLYRLPTLASNASPAARTLLKAWEIAQHSNASSPSVPIAYYSLNFEGYHFPGERPWEQRWDMIRSITDYTGKRVLELGCNMALLSIWLLHEANAEAALAVDADKDILRAARLISQAIGVNPTLAQVDFDASDNWEAGLLASNPDIVFALNVLNWVKNKQRFLDFLGNFNELIFEGHDPVEVEIERLQSIGYTSIKPVGISERGRTILHCLR